MRMVRGRKRENGSAIAEFGPSLFMFIVVLFFPLLDILGIAVGYCAGWYCNFEVCRELAVRKRNEAPAVFREVNTKLFATGIVNFLGCKTHTDTDVTPAATPVAGNPSDMFHHAVYGAAAGGFQPVVTCTTQVTITPFITVPFIPNTPGVSQPAAFVISSQRPREVVQ